MAGGPALVEFTPSSPMSASSRHVSWIVATTSSTSAGVHLWGRVLHLQHELRLERLLASGNMGRREQIK
jgi:hypothetical protein